MYVNCAVFLLIGGVLLTKQASADCSFSKCEGEDHASQSSSPMTDIISELQNLDGLCPVALPYVDCVHGELSGCLDRGESLGLPYTGQVPPERIAELLAITNNVRGLVAELCNETSELHAAYLKDVDCVFRELMSDDITCTRSSQETYQSFNQRRRLRTRNIRQQIERKCLTTRYLLACYSVKLGQKCGDTARRTFTSIVKRVDFLKFGPCDPMLLSGIGTLKQEFLNSLDLDSVNKTHFSHFFDRRRK